MNADGSNARDLTPTPAKLSYRDLTWSPDSSQLAVDCPSNGQNMGSDQICVLNVDGSGTRRIAPSGITLSNPAWSPDGRWIAAIGQQDGSQPYELYLLAPDGSDWRKVSADVANFEGFAWSPDGSQIAIVQSHPVGSTAYGTISIVNIDGSGQRDLNIGDVFPNDLAWSPDGSRILFQASVPGTSRSGVDIINVDGTGLREIVPKEVNIESVSWSPDGQAIAYTRYLYQPTPATPGTAPGIAEVGANRRCPPQWLGTSDRVQRRARKGSKRVGGLTARLAAGGREAAQDDSNGTGHRLTEHAPRHRAVASRDR